MLHNLKHAVSEWALKLAWSSAGFVVFGYGLAAWLAERKVDVVAEIVTATKSVFAFLYAISVGNFDSAFTIFLAPFSADPFVFIFGRYGLFFLIPAILILIVLALIRSTGRHGPPDALADRFERPKSAAERLRR